MSLSIRRSGTIAFGRIFTTVVRHSSQKRTQRCCLTNRFLNAPKTRSLITMAEKPNPAVSGTYGNLPGTSWTVELLPGTLPETKIGTGEIGEYETDLLAIGVYADIFETTKNGDTEVVTCTSDALMSKDDVLGGALAHILAKGDFKGEAGTSSVTRGSGSIRYVGLFGLGKKAEATVVPKWGRSVYFKYGENVGNTAKSNRTETVSIVFESQPESGLNTALSQLVFGILLNPFETFRFKEKADKKTPLKTISVMNVDPNVQSDIKKGYANANGSLLAMYSIESPPNVCYPQYLVDVATLIANKYKSTFKLKVNASSALKTNSGEGFGEEGLREIEYGAVLGGGKWIRNSAEVHSLDILQRNAQKDFGNRGKRNYFRLGWLQHQSRSRKSN